MIPLGTAYERARSAVTTLGKWPLDEASAASAAADDGPGANTLAATGSPGLAGTLWDSNEVAGQGSRTFDGSTQYFREAAGPSDGPAAAVESWTASGWFKADTTPGVQTFVAVSGDPASETAADNLTAMVGLNGTSLFFSWEYGAGNDVGDLLSAGVVAGNTYFAAFVKEVDRANAGKYKVTSYLYAKTDLDAGVLNPVIDVSDNLTNADNGDNGRISIGATGGIGTATSLFDGTLSDWRFDNNVLERAEIEDIIAGYYRAWDVEYLRTSRVWASHWKVYVKNSDGVLVDLSKIDDEDFLLEFEQAGGVDQRWQELNLRLVRGRDWKSTAPLDQSSGVNRNAAGSYTDLLGPMREVWLKYCICPIDYQPKDTNYESLFHGFTDKWKGDSRDTLTLPCRDRWAIVHDTQIKPTSATQDQKTYGSASGLHVGTVMQQIVNDQDRTYAWKLKQKPKVFIVGSTTYGILSYWQNLEPVGTALETIAVQNGWDIRYIYQPGMYTWRLTYYEPDRAASAADYTFAANDLDDVLDVGQSLEEYRNDIDIGYYDRNGTPQPNGDDPREIENAVASAGDLARYGEWYMRAVFLPNITTATEAQAVADAILSDLDVPALNLSCAMPFFPNVQLNDYYDFTASVWWSTATKAAVRSFVHRGSSDGYIETTLQCEGQPKTMKKGWLDMAVHPGVAPNSPRGTSPDTVPNPVCRAIDGGINVSWERIARSTPGNDFHRYTEVHVSSSGSGFPPASTTLAATVGDGTSVDVFAVNGSSLVPGTTYYVKLVHVDRFNNRTLASGFCSTAFEPSAAQKPGFHAYRSTDQTGITGTTVVAWTNEPFDATGDFDHTTNYEFTAPFDGQYYFDLRLAILVDDPADAGYALLEINTGSGYVNLARGLEVNQNTEEVSRAVVQVMLEAGDKIRGSIGGVKGTVDIDGAGGVTGPFTSYIQGAWVGPYY